MTHFLDCFDCTGLGWLACLAFAGVTKKEALTF